MSLIYEGIDLKRGFFKEKSLRFYDSDSLQILGKLEKSYFCIDTKTDNKPCERIESQNTKGIPTYNTSPCYPAINRIKKYQLTSNKVSV